MRERGREREGGRGRDGEREGGRGREGGGRRRGEREWERGRERREGERGRERLVFTVYPKVLSLLFMIYPVKPKG